MLTIAFDEAGNTGQHLTNSDQPLFVLASVNLTEHEVDGLLSKLRDANGDEAHYVKLRKSARGRDKIISVLSDPLISPDNVMAGVFHKRFMVMGKVIDLLLEPMASQGGLDLYSDGANVALANLHFLCMPALCGEAQADAFFEKFVGMIRTKTPDSVNEFYDHIQRMAEALKEHDYVTYLMALWSTCRIIDEVFRNSDKASLDPAIPAYVDLVAAWGERLHARFVTVHDQSKIIAGYRDFLLTLMDSRVEPVTLKAGPKSRVYPLKATDLVLRDSRNCKAIQIADIVAGSLSHWARAGAGLVPKDDFSTELQESKVGELIISTVWPSEDIVRHDTDGTEENPADVMAEFLRKQKRLD